MKTVVLSPTHLTAHAMLGHNFLAMGRLDDAAGEFALEPTAWARLVGQAILAARRGDAAIARQNMAAYNQWVGPWYYQNASALAALGDRQGALAMLEAGAAHRDSGLGYLNFNPVLDPLRAEPRFKAVQARLFGPG